jgi:nucleoside-diphosphate-sugar epimerase
LAANTEVQNSLQIENENLIKQVSLLNKLLLSMIDTNKILIFSSSCSVYAGSHDENININSKAKPVTSYDLVKSISDKLIEYYKETHNVKCASVRFSNIYGPDKELAKKTNRRILNILLSEMHINNMVEIVSDGKFYRNYIHVNDASRMLINIANNINTEQAIFIGCSKQNIYFIDAIKILADLYSREFKNPVKITTGRKLKYKSDVRSFKVQPSKIFLSHFNYEYDLKKGFQDLLKNTKF